MHSSKTRHIGVVALLIGLAVGAHAQQRRTYPSGTAFAENFGNVSTNADPCWASGPTSCDQTWAVASGSGQAIVAAPVGYGFGVTNVLEMPESATSLELDAYGTAPYIAQSSGAAYDLSVQFAYSSTNVTGFEPVLELQTIGAATPALEIGTNSNGSGSLYLSGNAVSVSAGIAHTLFLHIAGASSYAQVDGGAQTAFTANADDWFEVRLFNDTTGATFYFGPITVNGAATTGNWQPSMLADFAGQSGTVSGASLAAGTHCGNGSWSEGTSTTTPTFAFVSGSEPFSSTVSACGTAYTGNSGVALEATFPAASTGGYWLYTPYTTYPEWSFGVWWKTDAPDTVAFTDQLAIRAGPGFHVCGGDAPSGGGCASSPGYSTGPYLYVCAEETSGTTVGCDPISANVWYWVTMDWTPTGADTIDFYSATGAVVASFAVSDAGAASPVGLTIGQGGSESPGVQFDSWYSNPIMEYADAQFPVLPPSASGGACTLSLLGLGPC